MKFAFILSMLHYHCVVMQFKSKIIGFETSAHALPHTDNATLKKIKADLTLTVMDYTTKVSFNSSLPERNEWEPMDKWNSSKTSTRQQHRSPHGQLVVHCIQDLF